MLSNHQTHKSQVHLKKKFSKKSLGSFQLLINVVIVFSLIRQINFAISVNPVIFTSHSSIVSISSSLKKEYYWRRDCMDVSRNQMSVWGPLYFHNTWFSKCKQNLSAFRLRPEMQVKYVEMLRLKTAILAIWLLFDCIFLWY